MQLHYSTPAVRLHQGGGREIENVTSSSSGTDFSGTYFPVQKKSVTRFFLDNYFRDTFLRDKFFQDLFSYDNFFSRTTFYRTTFFRDNLFPVQYLGANFFRDNFSGKKVSLKNVFLEKGVPKISPGKRYLGWAPCYAVDRGREREYEWVTHSNIFVRHCTCGYGTKEAGKRFKICPSQTKYLMMNTRCRIDHPEVIVPCLLSLCSMEV